MNQQFILQLEQNRPVNNDLLDQMNSEFFAFNTTEREDAFAKMSQTFINDKDLDAKYKFSYFRWYTDFAWAMFNNQERDFVINIAMARQVPMAILLDFEVWRKVMWYLAMRTIDKEDMEALYFKMKEAFVNSEAIVGKWQGKDVLVKDLVKEITALNAKPKDSMQQAEFESRLQQIIFNKEDLMFEKYIATDPDTAIDRFIGLVHFFLGVEAEDIWYMVDNFLHPEKYELLISKKESGSKQTAQTDSVDEPELVEEEISNTNTDVAGMVKEEDDRLVAISSAESPLSTDQIKSQIESEFKKDSDGNFEDVERVLVRLGELSEQYNKPEIGEMMYFDESEGKFKWKE